MELIRGNKYRFKDQPDLMYIGKQYYGHWHKFTKFCEGRFGKVWAEAQECDLHMIEEVKGSN